MLQAHKKVANIFSKQIIIHFWGSFPHFTQANKHKVLGTAFPIIFWPLTHKINTLWECQQQFSCNDSVFQHQNQDLGWAEKATTTHTALSELTALEVEVEETPPT